MFPTVNSFLFFFIPATILFILGIIFEDKLIEFEDGLKRSICKLMKKKSKQSQVKKISVKKQRPAVKSNAVQKHRVNKAA